MKKIIGGITLIIGTVLIVFGIIAKIKGYVAISIIGGADGPTSVFVAGKVGDGFALEAILAGAVLAVVGAVVYKKLKDK